MIFCCLVVGFLSGLLTKTSIDTWYAALEKPFFTPPGWVFAPVWTVLYLLMGTAAGIIWNEINTHKQATKKALLFFFVQLFFNVLWVYLFFYLNNLLLASIEIFLLLLLIYETYYLFKTQNKTAGKLLLPYLFWVGFASILTVSIYILSLKNL